MKLDEEKRPVVVSGVGKVIQSRIDTDNSFIFEVLRSKIYQSKTTWLQEVLSNAHDAHVEAGILDRPVEVKLPICPNQMLTEVRDYGLGISPEKFEDVFINYNRSGKRDDDKQVGQFGCGALSPFSFADTFYVTTVHENEEGRIKYVYCLFIDESKKGSAALISKTHTEEECGTLVSVPVTDDSVREIHSAFVQYTEYWNLKPKVLNANIRYANEVVFDTPNWMLLSKGYNLFALVGQQCYIVRSESLKIPNLDLNICRGLVLKFHPSEVNLIVSREGLEYSEKTIDTIRQRLFSYKAELRSVLSTVISQIPSLKEANNKVLLLNEFVCNALMGARNSDFQLSYRGTALKRHYAHNSPLPINFYSSNYHSKITSETSVSSIDPGYPVIFNDTGLKSGFRLADILNKSGSTGMYFIQTDKVHTYEDIVQKCPLFSEQNLGMIRLSSLWSPKDRVKKPATVIPKDTLSAYSIVRNQVSEVGAQGILPYLIKEFVPLDGTPRVFVILGKVKDSRTGLQPMKPPIENLYALDFIKLLPLIGETVYAVRENMEDRIPPNWIHFQDKLQQVLEQKAQEVDPTISLSYARQIIDEIEYLRNHSFRSWSYQFSNQLEQISRSGALFKPSAFSQVLETYSKESSLKVAVDYIKSLYRYQSAKKEIFELAKLYHKENSTSTLEAILSTVEKDYPLINVLSREFDKALIEYYLGLEESKHENNKNP